MQSAPFLRRRHIFSFIRPSYSRSCKWAYELLDTPLATSSTNRSLIDFIALTILDYLSLVIYSSQSWSCRSWVRHSCLRRSLRFFRVRHALTDSASRLLLLIPCLLYSSTKGGGNMSLRNIGLSPSYTVSQPKRPHCSHLKPNNSLLVASSWT